MTEMIAETSMFSLADLAALTTDETTVLLSRLPDAGIFTVRCTEVKAGKTEGQDDKPPMFFVGYQYEILVAKPLDKSKDPETHVGKNMRERYTLWPTDFSTLVGLLQGRYKQVGLPFTGPFGAVEGAEPGWADSAVGHVFDIRVRHWTGKNGNNNASFDWLPQKDEDDKAA